MDYNKDAAVGYNDKVYMAKMQEQVKPAKHEEHIEVAEKLAFDLINRYNPYQLLEIKMAITELIDRNKDEQIRNLRCRMDEMIAEMERLQKL